MKLEKIRYPIENQIWRRKDGRGYCKIVWFGSDLGQMRVKEYNTDGSLINTAESYVGKGYLDNYVAYGMDDNINNTGINVIKREYPVRLNDCVEINGVIGVVTDVHYHNWYWKPPTELDIKGKPIPKPITRPPKQISISLLSEDMKIIPIKYVAIDENYVEHPGYLDNYKVIGVLGITHVWLNDGIGLMPEKPKE